MKTKIVFALALGLLLGIQNLAAQDLYQTCAVVFLNQDRIVDEVSPRGTSKISQSAIGQLTIREDLEEVHKGGEAVPFRLAIRKKKYNTLYMYSEKVYAAVDITSVLAECEPGDTIVLLLEKGKWAMVPNGEILVTE